MSWYITRAYGGEATTVGTGCAVVDTVSIVLGNSHPGFGTAMGMPFASVEMAMIVNPRCSFMVASLSDRRIVFCRNEQRDIVVSGTLLCHMRISDGEKAAVTMRLRKDIR